MGCRLRGHADAGGLCLAHESDRPGRRDVQQVEAAARETSERDIACSHQLLCLGWDPAQTQRGRSLPLVHLSSRSEGSLLAMLRVHGVERDEVLHRATGEQRVLHAVAVVREERHPSG